MPANLTETAISAAVRRAAESHKRVALPDPGQPGLQLRVTPTGSRTWNWYGRGPDGKPRRFVLGQHPAMGLSAARNAARAMREQARAGVDPVAEARRKRAVSKQAEDGIGTLAGLLDLYERQQGHKLKSWDEYRRRIGSVFERDLKTPLGTLTLGDLQLRADNWPAQQSAAAAVRYLRPILKWASAPGRRYVGRDLIELTPPATVKRRQRVLSRDELVALLPVLSARQDGYAAALQFMLLTLSRREEVCGATWGEIDLAAGLWSLPEARTKSDRPHVVPLSRQAVALLRARLPVDADDKPVAPDPEALIFKVASGVGLGNWDRATKRVQAASGTSGWTRHDLRRTGATLLGEMGIEPHLIESALNHAHIGGQLAATYNTARYRPQVASALQQLADLLDGFEGGGAEILSFTR